MFHKGDRVCLTPAMKKVMIHGLSPFYRKPRVDWANRVGTVTRDARYCGEVTVLWDNCKNTDHWPPKALEKIDVTPG